MAVRVVPLTPALWPALEALFGSRGAYAGCWCMYWRLPAKEMGAGGAAKRKTLFKRRVTGGPPPGVLAFKGEDAVGWLQIGPRADTPQWNAPKRVCAPLKPEDADDAGVWAATCFYVKAGWRGQGVTEALLAGGLKFAKKNRARVVEACPMAPEGRASSSGLYVGHAAVFARAGFKEVARRKQTRPMMRLALKR